MISDDENKRFFDKAANNLELWLHRADDLFIASNVLMERIESKKSSKPSFFDTNPKIYGIIFPAIMLRAFAVECFLKALWISKGNKVATNGVYKIHPLKKEDHDLVEISKSVGFTLHSNEEEILNRLSKFGKSFGRYPVARKWQEQKYKGNKFGSISVLGRSDYDRLQVDKLIERLKQTISFKNNVF